MRRMLCLCLPFLLPLPGISAQQLRIAPYADAAVCEALWSEGLDLSCGIEVRFNDYCSASASVSCLMAAGGKRALDTGILVKYFPFGRSFWIGMTMFEEVRLYGSSCPVLRQLPIERAEAGVQLKLTDRSFTEIGISCLDPAQVFCENVHHISSYLPDFPTYRIKVLVCWPVFYLDEPQNPQ